MASPAHRWRTWGEKKTLREGMYLDVEFRPNTTSASLLAVLM